MPFAEGQAEEHDVDQILADLEAPADAEPAAAPATPEQWAAPDWAQFEWNGKKVAPDSADKAKTWMSQGYNYSQRMGEHNNAVKAFELQKTAHEKKYKGYDRYDQINEYAASNPGWMEHVNKSWEARETAQVASQLPPELAPVLQPILDKFGQVDQFLTEQSQLKAEAEQKQNDAKLNEDIESIRKKYPNIDLASADATGVPLEMRVLKHANATGIPSFRAAFHDYMSDRLGELANANGREAVVKTQQQAVKTGLLGKSPAPVKGIQPARNVKDQSYEQLKQEALAELGLT